MLRRGYLEKLDWAVPIFSLPHRSDLLFLTNTEMRVSQEKADTSNIFICSENLSSFGSKNCDRRAEHSAALTAHLRPSNWA